MVPGVVIDFRKIAFLLGCVSMAACKTSLYENADPLATETVSHFGWYYKFSPVDFTATIDSNDLTIWHGRQGSIPYSTKAECISATEKSSIYTANAWNYKIDCREQIHPSQIQRREIDPGDIEIDRDE